MINDDIIGKTVIKFKNNKEVILPYKIREVITDKKRIFVRFAGNLPQDLEKKFIANSHLDSENRIQLTENDFKVIAEYVNALNQNVWCFDLEANLLWKIPKAYSDEKNKVEIDRIGYPYLTRYVQMRIEDEDELTVWTSYGNIIKVKISTGDLISRTEGIPFC